MDKVKNAVNQLDKRIRGVGANSAAAASAVAVGYSRASDNGKLILKLQGTANTQGEVSGGVGLGYQWQNLGYLNNRKSAVNFTALFAFLF